MNTRQKIEKSLKDFKGTYIIQIITEKPEPKPKISYIEGISKKLSFLQGLINKALINPLNIDFKVIPKKDFLYLYKLNLLNLTYNNYKELTRNQKNKVCNIYQNLSIRQF